MYYFAYDINLNRKQMQERCPESKPISSVTLPNYKLIFSGWSRQFHGGTATIQAERGSKVLGGLYEVTEKDLRRLDTYEGYPGQSNHIKVRVFDEDGTALEAITYIKTGRQEETKPSEEYLIIIRQGYRDWHLV